MASGRRRRHFGPTHSIRRPDQEWHLFINCHCSRREPLWSLIASLDHAVLHQCSCDTHAIKRGLTQMSPTEKKITSSKNKLHPRRPPGVERTNSGCCYAFLSPGPGSRVQVRVRSSLDPNLLAHQEIRTGGVDPPAGELPLGQSPRSSFWGRQ